MILNKTLAIALANFVILYSSSGKSFNDNKVQFIAKSMISFKYLVTYNAILQLVQKS